MLTFHNDPELKRRMIEEIGKHEAADAIVQGTYGDVDEEGKWKGCAVGCSIKSLGAIQGEDLSTSDHGIFETKLGIPRK